MPVSENRGCWRFGRASPLKESEGANSSFAALTMHPLQLLHYSEGAGKIKGATRFAEGRGGL